MIYTGVGSRETPPNVCVKMTRLAQILASRGWILRSGGAEGADTAFERGAQYGATGAAEIYLPWPGFNGRTSPLNDPTEEAYDLAAAVHPRGRNLPPSVRALHARNCYQVLGPDLKTPSKFLVCWTPDGCEKEATRTRETGGTATAIVLARRNNIPVFNLKNPESRQRLGVFLAETVPSPVINRWLGVPDENS